MIRRAWRRVKDAAATFALACVVLLLPGCSTIDVHTPPPSDWPVMSIEERRVSGEVMAQHCRQYVGFGQIPLACAQWNFAARRCIVWLDEGFAPDSIVQHERLHCRGYDHPGSTQVRESWFRYKRANNL